MLVSADVAGISILFALSMSQLAEVEYLVFSNSGNWTEKILKILIGNIGWNFLRIFSPRGYDRH